jgi:hypothetical protein
VEESATSNGPTTSPSWNNADTTAPKPSATASAGHSKESSIK